MRSLSTFAFLAALLPALAKAQQTTVTGVVRDATSSTPLVGAIVTLGRGADERTTRSDASGAFSFSKVARGAYPLTVRRLGYEPSQVDVDVPQDQPVVASCRSTPSGFGPPTRASTAWSARRAT
jgi:hypothetical protein